jgi:archaellum component FlaF (FlaF/FlaG flagellin family)
MKHRSMVGFRRYFLISAGIIYIALLMSCKGCNPPATVDTPASNLDLKVTIIDTDPNPSDGKVPVVAQFLLNGAVVQFGSSAQVTCNGVTLAFNGVGNAERVPMVAPGGTYSIVYTRGGTPTTLNATAPPRPTIVSPTANSTVTRSSSLTITYVSDGGAGVRGSAGDGSTGLGGNQEPDNGNYTGFNVSSLKAGPGTLGLTREFQNTVGGTGFKSAQVTYNVGSSIKVTWN